ncbi:MAG: hypothetical protein PW792_10590 [Acidobacteriaceae bacterium]|nr:hypothetical protein [Acidobacteriaceae bacterium]
MPTMSKQKKIGRPRLDKDQAMTKIVPIRFSALDLQKIERAASKTNQTISQFIRSGVTNASISDDLIAVIRLLGKLRNQYAFAGNIAMSKKCERAIAEMQRE